MSVKERKTLRSNAEWILIQEADGSIIAKSQTTNEEQKLSKKDVDSMKSLVSLLEGGNIKIE